MTVAPPRSRSHLVPAILSAALLCVAFACPAIGKQPASVQQHHAAKTHKQRPGHAKKHARRLSPGHAKKLSGARTLAHPGKTVSAPAGRAKKSSRAQATTTTSAGQAPGQAKKTATAQASASRVAGRVRAGASSRRAGAASTRRAAAASRRAAASARRAARARATTATTSALAAASSPPAATGTKPKPAAKKRQQRPFLPVTPRNELPQPLRVVRDIVHVVPTPLRVLVAGLVALAILLAGAAGMTLLRNRRLDRQRRELLGHVGLLQAALLPEVPELVGAARASVAYRPADGPGAGGDFYDIIPLAGGETAVLIGDVSGHGREALGRTALVRYTMRAYIEAGLEPSEALQVAGSVLAGRLEGDFVTALIAVHDSAAGTLTYATAGHPPPVVLSRLEFEPVLVASAPPIGVGAGTGQRQTTLPFPRGSIACFYTDGLSEARMEEGQLGVGGLERLIRELGPDVTAEQVIDRVAASATTIPDDSVACVLSAEDGAAIVRTRLERLEVSRADMRGPMVRGFLDACGVSAHRVRAAEREARELARETGGAILEVRMGERADVDVRPPEIPLRDELTASLRQP